VRGDHKMRLKDEGTTNPDISTTLHLASTTIVTSHKDFAAIKPSKNAILVVQSFVFVVLFAFAESVEIKRSCNIKQSAMFKARTVFAPFVIISFRKP